MKLRNFWLNRSNEKNILKVVDWSHKNNLGVFSLKIDEIVEALKTYIRESIHA